MTNFTKDTNSYKRNFSHIKIYLRKLIIQKTYKKYNAYNAHLSRLKHNMINSNSSHILYPLIILKILTIKTIKAILTIEIKVHSQTLESSCYQKCILLVPHMDNSIRSNKSHHSIQWTHHSIQYSWSLRHSRSFWPRTRKYTKSNRKTTFNCPKESLSLNSKLKSTKTSSNPNTNFHQYIQKEWKAQCPH